MCDKVFGANGKLRHVKKIGGPFYIKHNISLKQYVTIKNILQHILDRKFLDKIWGISS
jgi:hypothetical protein